MKWATVKMNDLNHKRLLIFVFRVEDTRKGSVLS